MENSEEIELMDEEMREMFKEKLKKTQIKLDLVQDILDKNWKSICQRMNGQSSLS